MQCPQPHNNIFIRALLIILLAIFCAPYTVFDEAQAYIADTENEMVHYYLTPLPDNGEACAEAPAISAALVVERARPWSQQKPIYLLLARFFHPPRP